MITSLWVFDDDKQIIKCLTNDEVFKGAIIDDEEHQAEMKYDNFIPKGVRTLERMFNLKVQKTSQRKNAQLISTVRADKFRD